MRPPADAGSVLKALAARGQRVTAPDLIALARQTPIEELPSLLGSLAEAEAMVRLRLNTVTAPATFVSGNGYETGPERLLTPTEAASIVGAVSSKWILRHTKGLRFRRDLSRKVVRFEDAGLRRWASARKA
jgi:hypothetical protein